MQNKHLSVHVAVLMYEFLSKYICSQIRLPYLLHAVNLYMVLCMVPVFIYL